MLLSQKGNINFYLSNDFFKNEEIVSILKKIIDEGFFLKKDRLYFNNNKYSSWACDFRIPLLNSSHTRILFPYIAKYISNLNHTIIGLKGHGAFPFIGLSQYSNINKVLLIRENKKSYGFQQEIEGAEIAHNGQIIDFEDKKNFNDLVYINAEGQFFSPYKKLCLIDDICNTGNSMLKAKNILYNNNYTVTNYFSLFNYKWGNKKINENQFHYIIEVYKK
jgi:orotate phosphoribosyltransferase